MAVHDERSERLELVATVLLGVATLASAWCTYQSELWNSEQLEKMANANLAQTESLRATEVANRNAILDAATFANLVQAEARGDERAVRFLGARVRPAFKPILEAWVARGTKQGPPPGTPFDDPAYRAQADAEIARLRDQARALLQTANVANANSDRFVMRTVLFTLSLFFLGIAGQLNGRLSRRLALIFGAVVLVLTLLTLVRLPRAAPPGPVPREHTTAPG